MVDSSRIIAPSPEELEAIKAACERAGLAMGRRVTQVEIDQILDLLGLKQLPQTQRMEAQADDRQAVCDVLADQEKADA